MCQKHKRLSHCLQCPPEAFGFYCGLIRVLSLRSHWPNKSSGQVTLRSWTTRHCHLANMRWKMERGDLLRFFFFLFKNSIPGQPWLNESVEIELSGKNVKCRDLWDLSSFFPFFWKSPYLDSLVCNESMLAQCDAKQEGALISLFTYVLQ